MNLVSTLLERCLRLPTPDTMPYFVNEPREAIDKVDITERIYSMVDGRALFYPTKDVWPIFDTHSNFIEMPSQEWFQNDDIFLTVLAHEAIHFAGWKIHQDVAYIKSAEILVEELIATVGGALLLSEVGAGCANIAHFTLFLLNKTLAIFQNINLDKDTKKKMQDEVELRVHTLTKKGK